ncbi:MAG: AAA family ATPase [Bacteriovoracaceae bacterium]
MSKQRKPIVIAIAQHKGGVGKTTSCLSISEALAKKGRAVLLIDLDIQANLSLSVLGKNHAKNGILGYLKDPAHTDVADIIHESNRGVFIIPNEKRLNGEVQDINALFGEGIKSFLRIEALLKNDLVREFDYIFIDLPPSKDKVIANAMMAANYYIIPVEASDYCLDGIEELISFINEAKEYNENLELLGMYMPNVDLRLKANKELIKELKEELGSLFIDIGIPTNAKVSTLPAQGKTIFDLKGKDAKGQEEYVKLATEIERRVAQNEKELNAKGQEV